MFFATAGPIEWIDDVAQNGFTSTFRIRRRRRYKKINTVLKIRTYVHNRRTGGLTRINFLEIKIVKRRNAVFNSNTCWWREHFEDVSFETYVDVAEKSRVIS